MPFLFAPITQVDYGDPLWQANCGPAVTAELLGLTSVDRIRVTPRRVRSETSDWSGGVEGGPLASAANRIGEYLYPFLYRSFDDWRDVRELLEHSSAGIIVDCSKTIRTKYRTGDFTGNHWFTLAGGTIKDDTVKYEDPGTSSVGWWRIPLRLVREASDFGGRHWVLTTPPTEGALRQARVEGIVRARPDTGARLIGRFARGAELAVRRTRRGGPWRRADGSAGHGWYVVEWKGGVGFVPGKLLVPR